MGKTEFRWLVIRGQPVAGAIRFGGPQDNLWQVLQLRQELPIIQPGSNHLMGYEWGEWQNMPVTFAPPPTA